MLGLAVLTILLPWARHAPIMITFGIITTFGIIIRNTLLSVPNATFLNIGSPVLGRIAPDVGSGVSAFLVTALALRVVLLTEHCHGRECYLPQSFHRGPAKH